MVDPGISDLAWEDLEGEPKRSCPLEATCGEFYDCSDEPIISKYGWVEVEGETEGEVPWNSGEQLWSCDEVPKEAHYEPRHPQNEQLESLAR